MLIVGILSVFSISFAWADTISFGKIFSILVSIFGFVLSYLYKTTNNNDAASIQIKQLETALEEQDRVLKEYEQIFDSQLVELPCVCGGNTFQGLFSPKTENIVECEKCKNKYNVTIDYNSILITEPLNLNTQYDKLVEQFTNEG